ncbi:hypothetical protein pb186bvf_017907 [Paramecium bursaria]
MDQFNKISEFEDCYSIFTPEHRQTKHKIPPLQQVFEETCKIIDTIAQEVEAKKFKKVAKSLLLYILEELIQQGSIAYELAGQQYYNLKIKFIYLQVDHGEERRVQDFYSELLKTKESQNDLKGKTVKIEYEKDKEKLEHDKDKEKQGFITTSIEFQQIEDQQEYSQIMSVLKGQFKQNVNSYLTILLLQNQMNLDQMYDLKKMLQEDIQFKVESRKSFYQTIIFIVPASDQQIGTFEMNGLFDKKYYFTDPQNVMIKLLFNLIKENRIPLLSNQIYKQILNDFSIYLTSFKDELNLLKSAYFLFYSKKGGVQLDKFLGALLNKPAQNENFHKYILQREKLRSNIEFIQVLVKNMKRLADNTKLKGIKMKLINLLQNQRQYSKLFQIQYDENYQQLLDLFEQLQPQDKAAQAFINDASKYVNSDTKFQSNDRVVNLLHRNSKQERLEDYLNKFVQQFIIDGYDNIHNKFSEYTFTDIRSLNEHTQPDVFSDYHKVMTKTSELPHVRNTQQLYANIGRSAINVPASEINDEEENKFFYSITEMKLLGLIEGTKKQKPTYQRHYFAKQMFANYTD